jgi:glycosyltransferase involved in cell wall biosynthesis
MTSPFLSDRSNGIVPASPKIGIFIVTFNARSTIASVLARIKPRTWDRISQVFVFDDSSQDGTCDEAVRAKRTLRMEKVRVFHNRINLGYGGNQKRGYLYAIHQNLDIVVLLHGDGQYAPECLDDLIEPLVRGEAEAVLGSRMLTPGAARKGGMPLYKYLGNRILTWFENRILGAVFSEYHSGYRAYHVPSLARVPFLENSNDFHFDNEIIVQFLEAGHRIKEVPVPTYYGDEICHVNGLKYAGNVVKTTLKYWLHKTGLFCYAKQFDMQTAAKYTLKENRFSSHSRILDLVQREADDLALNVLDVGCGTGLLAARLASDGHCVVGADMYDSAEARRNCHEFHVGDIEQGFGTAGSNQFDCVIFADILEHIRNPERTLLRARSYLKPGRKVIASTGNVAHLLIRLSLLLGWFTYTERGILDRTHLRLFTRRTFRQLFEACSFRVVRQLACPIPFEKVMPRWRKLAAALSWLNMLLVWI